MLYAINDSSLHRIDFIQYAAFVSLHVCSHHLGHIFRLSQILISVITEGRWFCSYIKQTIGARIVKYFRIRCVTQDLLTIKSQIPSILIGELHQLAIKHIHYRIVYIRLTMCIVSNHVLQELAYHLGCIHLVEFLNTI